MTLAKGLTLFLTFAIILLGFGIGAFVLGENLDGMDAGTTEANSTNATLQVVGTFTSALQPVGYLVAVIFVALLLIVFVKKVKF